MKNGLELTFDGSEPFVASTRIIGPLTNITASPQQGGVFLWPDQDNYIKFVAGANTATERHIQFFQEVNSARAEVGYLVFLDFGVGKHHDPRSHPHRGAHDWRGPRPLRRQRRHPAGPTDRDERPSVGPDVHDPGCDRAAFFNAHRRRGSSPSP